MAEVTLRLRHNPATGERELVIHYESEDDALPHEHERAHREIVEKILGRAIGEDERVVVERSRAARPAEATASRDESPTTREARAHKGG
jgi:hypothetical protein